MLLEDLDKKVIGLAYLRFKYAYDIDKLLSGPQRHAMAMDYWMGSGHNDKSLVFVEVVAAERCIEPELVQSARFSSRNDGLFSSITSYSFERLVENGPACPGAFADVWNAWSLQHGISLDPYEDMEGNVFISSVVVMPSAHGICCVSRIWTDWCFPFLPSNQRRGHAYKIGRPLWAPMDMQGGPGITDHVKVDETEELSDEQLLGIGNSLRFLKSLLSHGNDLIRATVDQQVEVMQRMRDNMLLHRAALTRLAHALDVLLTSIVFSGLLRSAHDLKEATEHALDITIRDHSLSRVSVQVEMADQGICSSFFWGPWKLHFVWG